MNEYKFLHQYPLNGKLKVGAYARISKDGTDLENSLVINRDRLIFVIGSDDLSTLPLNPNKIPMKYICEYKYKMRSTRSTCYFGIYINK